MLGMIILGIIWTQLLPMTAGTICATWLTLIWIFVRTERDKD